VVRTLGGVVQPAQALLTVVPDGRPTLIEATAVDRQEQPLSPGMAVTADIKTGQQGVISYLLSPLRCYAHEGIGLVNVRGNVT
jgi:multidrug efflux pump subunit AcrA (membrane-fusion protein)